MRLFIPETEQDAPPCLYAGPRTYLSDKGERPVRFRWESRHPLPPDVFHFAKVKWLVRSWRILENGPLRDKSG